MLLWCVYEWRAITDHRHWLPTTPSTFHHWVLHHLYMAMWLFRISSHQPIHIASHHRCHVICRNYSHATNTLRCGKFNKEVNQKILVQKLQRLGHLTTIRSPWSPRSPRSPLPPKQDERTNGRTDGRTDDWSTAGMEWQASIFTTNELRPADWLIIK